MVTPCSQCGKPPHAFDILCPSCGAVLVAEPTEEQLLRADRLARIRSHLASTAVEKQPARLWPDIAKALLPVVATIVVAVGGWIITSSWNKSQTELQQAQQAATRSAAEANASLAYLQFLARDPSPPLEQRDQALMAAAGVLPPELSFNLAVRRLPSERSLFNRLLRLHGDDSYKYLTYIIEDTIAAEPVLLFLHEQNLLDREFEWIVGPDNKRPQSRLLALMSYFSFLKKLDASEHPEIYKPASRALVARVLGQGSIDVSARSDVAAAAALVFVTEPGYEPDWNFQEMAAATFWDSLDVSVGALPAQGGLRYRLFFTRLHISHGGEKIPTPAVKTASNVLVERLLASTLEQRSIFELGRLLYSYCAYVPRDGPGPFSTYLTANDCLRLVRGVTTAATDRERRQRLSHGLGSLTGHALYRSVGRDTKVQRMLTEHLLKWYEDYAAADWEAPKFLDDAVRDHADLSNRIDAVFKKRKWR
jgi:hypothetical protein